MRGYLESSYLRAKNIILIYPQSLRSTVFQDVSFFLLLLVPNNEIYSNTLKIFIANILLNISKF